MAKWDKLDRLFMVWAFLFQIVLVVHYALRKPFFESDTLKFGWIVFARNIVYHRYCFEGDISLNKDPSWGVLKAGVYSFDSISPYFRL